MRSPRSLGGVLVALVTLFAASARAGDECSYAVPDLVIWQMPCAFDPGGAEMTTVDGLPTWVAAPPSEGLAILMATTYPDEDGLALMLVNVYRQLTYYQTQVWLQARTDRDLADLDEFLRGERTAQYGPGGLTVLDWYGTRRQEHPLGTVLISEYRRLSAKPGSVTRVTEILLLDGLRSFRIVMGYRETMADLFQPIVDRIRETARPF